VALVPRVPDAVSVAHTVRSRLHRPRYCQHYPAAAAAGAPRTSWCITTPTQRSGSGAHSSCLKVALWFAVGEWKVQQPAFWPCQLVPRALLLEEHLTNLLVSLHAYLQLHTGSRGMLRPPLPKTTALMVPLAHTTASWPVSSGTAPSTATANTHRWVRHKRLGCRPVPSACLGDGLCVGCNLRGVPRVCGPQQYRHHAWGVCPPWTKHAKLVANHVCDTCNGYGGLSNLVVDVCLFLSCALSGHWRRADKLGHSHSCGHEPLPGFSSRKHWAPPAAKQQRPPERRGQQTCE
jgi:hypothetical protein